MLPNNTEKIVEFLQIDCIDFSNFERIATQKIATLIDSDVQCKFDCPVSIDEKIETQYLCYSSSTDEIKIESELESNSNKEISYQNFRTIYFDSFEEQNYLRPHMHLISARALDPSEIHLIEFFVQDLFFRIVRRQYALIRRAIVDAQIDSDDLNSFLFRVINENSIHKLIGAEAVSIFVQDPIGKLLRLRGTSGLKGSKPKNDIYFHEDSNVKVWEVLTSDNPIFEYSPIIPLSNGESAEKIRGNVYFRAYWPIKLRGNFSSNDLLQARTPTIGVMRVVNSSILNRANFPFTSLRMAAMNFSCEALFIIIDSYQNVGAASFKRDEAFHGSMSVIDTVCKNVDLVRRWLFDEVRPTVDPPIDRQFSVIPKQGSIIGNPARVRRLLDTAYASAADLGFQIERANQHSPISRTEYTERFMTEVFMRAWGLIEDMMIAHSVGEGLDRPQHRELFEKASYPPAVVGSPDALISVFANVLENSLKYRRPNVKIKLEVDFELTDDYFVVNVRDHGIGVRDDDLERIFTSGYRTSEARDIAKRGNGLGLAWCREVLRPIQGRITAERCDPGLRIVVSLLRRDRAWTQKNRS